MDLKHIVTKRKKAISVGGYDGGERDWYHDMGFEGVLWIEPNPEAFRRLKTNIAVYPNQIALNVGLHDTLKKATLHITNNIASSSLLEMDKHLKYHPEVRFVKDIEVKLMSGWELFEVYGFRVEDYNFLNIDVQGVELNVIKSFRDYIDEFDYIYAEVNEEHLYKDCSLIGDIDEYLSQYRFKRVITQMTKYKWGDALYVKT